MLRLLNKVLKKIRSRTKKEKWFCEWEVDGIRYFGYLTESEWKDVMKKQDKSMSTDSQEMADFAAKMKKQGGLG